MKFEEKIYEYLDGTLFSSGLNVTISHPEETILNRFDLLEEMVKGKHIVHIGCVDHLPLIDEKIKNNLWLHSRLCQKSARCFGVDINLDGINYIRDIKGYKDVICADITTDDIIEIKNGMWDYMLLGEILEHVDNPCYFLTSIQKKYSGVVNRLIITVPNAFAYLNTKCAYKHIECINSDHKYWFTPYTLAKLATMSHMKIERFEFCEPVAINESFPSMVINWKYHLYYKPLLKRYPSMRETLVMVLKL